MYHALHSKSLLSTKYLDMHTLIMLGLMTNATYMFGNVGWKSFVEMQPICDTVYPNMNINGKNT